MTGRVKLLPIVMCALHIGYYWWFSHQRAVPPTGRKEMVDVNPRQEAGLRLQSYRHILNQSQVAGMALSDID